MSDFFAHIAAAGIFILIAVFIAAGTYFLTRWNNYKSLSAKYRDRLYELNKLGVQYGDVAYQFLNPANFTGNYFNKISVASSKPGVEELNDLQLVARMRSYVFFRLNFYEELFYATESGHVVVEDREVWRSYLEAQLRHPLVLELLNQEKHRFGQKFVAFSDIARQGLEAYS